MCRPFLFNPFIYKMKYISFLLLLSIFAFVRCSDDTKVISLDWEEDDDDEPVTTVGNDIHIDGRYLVDANGNVINLHGYTQTYSPQFNNNAWKAGDVEGCLAYNKMIDDGLRAAGWKFNFVRLHMDPVWSDDPSKPYVRYEGHERFSLEKFKNAFERVFLPMAEYYIAHGEYVVMRPPGVCPEELAPDDDYYQFLSQVWTYVSDHKKVRNNMKIMFELANEPVRFNGSYQDVSNYFQGIVDQIRGNCMNIIWVPGLSWQMEYRMYSQYPIKGKNVGYAVHCYPGWYGSPAEEQPGEFNVSLNGNEAKFKAGWATQVGCVARFAPVMVTEIDWAPAHYNVVTVNGTTKNEHLCTWGSSTTSAFGRPFKKIADESGNVSWLLFTTSHHRYLDFKDEEPVTGKYEFMNDPEACPWPIWHWFKKYAEE